MTQFKTFADAVHQQYANMSKNELYTVDVEDIFASYLAAFPEGTNPMFRTRTEHDCNCCKQFIRRLGTVIGFDEDGNRVTVWDRWGILPHPYAAVAKALRSLVVQAPIRGVFRTKEAQYGALRTPDNHDNLMWDHFMGRVADRHLSRNPEEARGKIDAKAHVFERGLRTLSPFAVATVLDLIEGRALYRGEEFKAVLKAFEKLQTQWLASPHQAAFVWANCDNVAATIRNTAIGTLLVDLSEGLELEAAVRMFEAKVAPANYKRPTALVTPRMIEQAVGTLTELGLANAVHRRVARIGDVSINDVIWADRGVAPQMKDSLTSLLMGSAKVPEVSVKGATPITIEQLVRDVLPGAEGMSLLVENRHSGNFVSITGSDDPAPLFKWGNGFGWSYDGDVTDSIKERVKRAGGNVENAVLRVSLAWHCGDDLDLHCRAPEGHIYYGNRVGVLDVDMNAGSATNRIDPVENMSWRAPRDGIYRFEVNQYNKRTGGNPGFDIELWANGESQFFTFPKDMRTGQSQEVFSFRVTDHRRVSEIKVHPALSGGTVSRAKWGLATQTLVPVDTLMLSPNHWEGSAMTGNKHWFFLLRGCSNPEPTRGIYNEFLRGDLEPHRKVFEVLGSKTKADPDPQGLAGLGFSSTKQEDCFVLVTKDGYTRPYQVQF